MTRDKDNASINVGGDGPLDFFSILINLQHYPRQHNVLSRYATDFIIQ